MHYKNTQQLEQIIVAFLIGKSWLNARSPHADKHEGKEKVLRLCCSASMRYYNALTLQCRVWRKLLFIGGELHEN